MTPDPVSLELYQNRFTAVAAAMGEMLRRTALSTNVKDRLDFSCALLDPAGRLVVNAPHIPVHLGALGLCVREVAAAVAMAPGDVVVTNHPAYGGSHLPDVTVVTPVHDAGGALLGYTASRAHHAEIGGSRPGSMPPAARTLAEEGVVIAPRHLVRGGEPRWDDLRALLAGGRWPSRAVDENLADLDAAVAANHRGARDLERLAADAGAGVVRRHMAELAALSRRRLAAALERLPPGPLVAEERLDDGSPIRVTASVADGRLVLDFAGTAGVHPGNLNAPRAVVRSAVLYVLRLLVAEDLPLNEGLLADVDLRVPPGMLDPPFPDDPERCPAVVGGNVETSQRVVDALLRAFGLVAGSQGTMNNVLFGNERFGYYETVCGGAGAGPGFPGESAVHTHMTNTRITDPEVLELRYPVRLHRFAIRHGSGGAGAFPGGDGAVRELEFLAPVSLSLLAQHRVERPYGMEGGAPGAVGRQRLVRVDGTVEELPGIAEAEASPGDRLILETPGGGGWGRPLPVWDAFPSVPASTDPLTPTLSPEDGGEGAGKGGATALERPRDAFPPLPPPGGEGRGEGGWVPASTDPLTPTLSPEDGGEGAGGDGATAPAGGGGWGDPRRAVPSGLPVEEGLPSGPPLSERGARGDFPPATADRPDPTDEAPR